MADKDTNQSTWLTSGIDFSVHIASWAQHHALDEDDYESPDLEDILDPSKNVKLHFAYPLSNPVTIEFSTENPDGFTIRAFLDAIASGYQRIYSEEAETSTVKEGTEGVLVNHNKTDDRYGIWGHGLADLYLDGAYKENEVWHLEIGS